MTLVRLIRSSEIILKVTISAQSGNVFLEFAPHCGDRILRNSWQWYRHTKVPKATYYRFGFSLSSSTRQHLQRGHSFCDGHTQVCPWAIVLGALAPTYTIYNCGQSDDSDRYGAFRIYIPPRYFEASEPCITQEFSWSIQQIEPPSGLSLQLGAFHFPHRGRCYRIIQESSTHPAIGR